MLSADPDIRRLITLRAMEGGLLRLKWLAAATRFEIALLRHDRALKRAYALKYGYNPNQPRVPAGDPAGGQWTSEGARERSRQSSRDKSGPHATSTTIELSADNRRDNKMVRDVIVQLGLNKNQAQQLHREISGQGLGYHEILQIAKDMFGK